MKKVLVLVNKDITILYVRKELIEKLLQEGYDVTVSFPKTEKVKDFEEMGCKFINSDVDRRGMNPFRDFKLLLQYIKAIKTSKPDIVLTFTIKPNLYGGIACRIKKVPFIANITGLGTALQKDGFLKKMTIFLYHIAFKNVKCCFMQNRDNYDFFEENKLAIGKKKIIPGSGVNLEKYKLLEYPSEQDDLEFLFIGRVLKEKGIDLYFDTAKYIKSKYPNTKFHVLGFCEDEYEEKLKQLEDEGIVIYHGRQDNMIPFYKLSCCTIHPSYYPEGMSNVLLESEASGRPVITTDSTGCREPVDDGITGYIVPIKDLDSLIKKVEEFINLPYEEKVKMGQAGRRKVEKEFDRNIVINAYLEEIK